MGVNYHLHAEIIWEFLKKHYSNDFQERTYDTWRHMPLVVLGFMTRHRLEYKWRLYVDPELVTIWAVDNNPRKHPLDELNTTPVRLYFGDPAFFERLVGIIDNAVFEPKTPIAEL